MYKKNRSFSKVIQSVAIVVAAAYLPVLFIGMVVFTAVFDFSFFTYWLIVNTVGAMALLILCNIEVKKMGGVALIGLRRVISLNVMYIGIPLFFSGMVIGFETAGEYGMRIVAISWFCIVIGSLLCFFVGGAPTAHTKAEKYNCPYQNYADWEENFEGRAAELFDYALFRQIHFEEGQFSLYIRRPASQVDETLDCIAITKTRELSDEIIEYGNDEITGMLKEYCGCKTIRIAVNMIGIFCVDKVSNAFYKLVNSNMEQGMKNGRLVVGISFGGKQIYVANQQGGFGIKKYIYLKEQFMGISSLNET